MGRKSWDAIQTIAQSKMILWVWAICAPIATFSIGLTNGWDDITSLKDRATALELALGESMATVVSLEARIIELDKRLQKSDDTNLKRNIDVCRAIVLSNAPRGKSDAFQNDYDMRIGKLYPGYETIDVDKKTACDVASAVLKWGSVPLR